MAKSRKEVLHPAEQYARDVIDGKIIACRWVRLACERHVHDLKHAHKRGYIFSPEAAQHVIDFLQQLRQSKGKWGRGRGEFLQLQPWQQFYIWVAFGWLHDNSERWIERTDTGEELDTRGARRFRFAYLEVARKNGKSTMAAGLGIYLAFIDQEPSAEVFSCGTKLEQAKIVHQEAKRMVRKNPGLKKHIKVYKNNLSFEFTDSKYEPLGSDSDNLDGLNIHGIIADELHAWKNRDLWDVLETATGSRLQPMFIPITTAGMDRLSVCFEKHEHTRKLLEGWKDHSYEDDTWFGMIYTLDKDDDWRDEKVWIKANPNLGVSKYLSDLRAKAKRAENMPSSLNGFKRRELNIWVRGEFKWMPMDKWHECGGDTPALELPKKLIGRTCYAGLDLSSTEDITAFVMVFLDEEKDIHVICRFWVPEEHILIRTRDAGVNYERWMDEGYIQATPGNTIDYDWIYEQIERDAEMFDIDQIAYDRWGASSVVQELEKRGFTVVKFGQGDVSMNPPMQELERAVLSGKIKHGDNPVLTWMADNLVAKMGPTGLLKPDKAKSAEKIDGITALLMGLDMALRHPEKVSVYEKRGIRKL